MKKLSAGLVCVFLSVVIAVFTVGCSGDGELSYTGEAQTSSTGASSVTSTTTLPAFMTSTDSSETESTSEAVETVLYQLTTQQGETVQVVSTTQAITVVPTMNYDPVTIPTMATTYLNTTAAAGETTVAATTTEPTTAYVPPTYSGDVSGVTTKAPEESTTETTEKETTEAKVKYVNINDTSAMTSGKYIIVSAEDKFGGKINSNKGTLTIFCSGSEMTAQYNVLKELDADGYVQIKVDIPAELESIMESTSGVSASIQVPKGAITSEDNISNNAFAGTLYIN